MTPVQASTRPLGIGPASPYTWIPPGEPGAWGELMTVSSLMRFRVRLHVYAEPEYTSAAGRSYELEMASWTAASRRIAARIDDYIDELEEAEGEQE
jgi:hypothetical protein